MFCCTLEHYNIIKTSYYRNFDSILIIEDDIQFIENIDKVYQSVSKLPLEWNILHIHNTHGQCKDSCPYQHGISVLKDIGTVNGDWIKLSNTWNVGGLYSGAYYALSRKGMKAVIDNKESHFEPLDLMFRNLCGITNYYIPLYQLTDYAYIENEISRNKK